MEKESKMLSEMREIRAIIAGLEEKYDIRVIRLTHEDNQIQLDNGFGNLPTDNELVDTETYEEYLYHSILVEGTKFLYLERKEGINDNN